MIRIRPLLRAVTACCLLVGLAPVGSALPEESQVFEFDSYKDIVELFDQLGYTEAAWNEGLREVNRVYLQNMPSRWRQKHSSEVEIKMKKELFLRTLAPLVLRSNELIMEERAQLLAMLEAGQSDDPWLRALAEKYRVAKPEDPAPGPQQLDELLHRVDLVPNSLALAQTIEESGWGTSRFADVGNAMFGQWAWGEDAIKPEQQRSGKGNYGIRAFDSPQDSVNGYMLNINSHPAYADLRNKRVAIRGEGRVPTGPELTDTLLKYSERGQHYVDTLNSIMRVNKLVEIDEAHLVDPVILLVPVGEGAD
jgi:Bax protein